ncbi:MAG: tRNA adenosine(34) deaminase TadA [Gammaproteobacteria bacterium]|nr:tRNA adenosine(34) deaminase TadA [Gammaproteobacteria bacterium]
MQQALIEAKAAYDCGEVPVGAVLVYEGEIIARGRNRMIELNDPSAHAEILTLREAGSALSNYRLLDTTLYVTLEPCLMCFGALVHARIGRLVFAATDPKTGVCGSACEARDFPFLNHQFEIESGIMAEESSQLLKQFFKEKRNESSSHFYRSCRLKGQKSDLR